MSATATVADIAERLAADALALARVFAAGGHLWVVSGDRPDHARHVAVEFLHPVITGARALPATAVEDGGPVATRPGDAVLLIDPPAGGTVDGAAVTIDLTDIADADLVGRYHVLWELTHLMLEHPGLVGGGAVQDHDPTGFLYPFLDAGERGEADLMASARASAEAKLAESERVADAARTAAADTLRATAATIAERLARGGRLLLAGNGGSACDVSRLARLARAAGWPVIDLTTNAAVVTALSNDIGARAVFARQIDAIAGPDDVVILASTSGASANLVLAADRSARAAAATVGLAGYSGGGFVDSGHFDHVLAVDSCSVHRIQEAQALLIDDLIGEIREVLA